MWTYSGIRLALPPAMLQLLSSDLASVTGGAKGKSSLIEATKLEPTPFQSPEPKRPGLAEKLGLIHGAGSK
jgi:hypothetical protein